MLERITFFLWLWKFCGLCQIRVKRMKNGLFTLEPVQNVFTIIALAQCALTILTGLKEMYETIYKDLALIMTKGKVMFLVDIAMVSLTVPSGILSGIFHRSEFMKILLDLEAAERYLSKVSRRNLPSGLPMYIIVSYTVNLAVMSAALAYDWWAWTFVFDSFSWSYQYTYVSFLASTGLILKFVYVVSYVKVQFEKINHLFKEHLETIYAQQNMMDTQEYMISTKIRLTSLHNLVVLHDKLYETIARINLVFGPQNIFALMYLMEQLVCCPFYSIVNRQLFDLTTDGVEHFIYLYILWTVAVLFLLITVLFGCSKAKHEALELRKIIARYLNPLKTNNFPNDYIILYLMKLNKPYPGFTVFGLVELDLPLAQSMIATSMTYLVIFLQF